MENTTDKDLQEKFEQMCGRYPDESIKKFAEIYEEIGKVVSGTEHECLSIFDYGDELYTICYFVNDADKVKAYFLELSPMIENRNELTAIFCLHLCYWLKYENSLYHKMFNSFQSLQKTFFEKLGYFVLNEAEIEQLKGFEKAGLEATLLIPGSKGLIYLPYLK